MQAILRMVLTKQCSSFLNLLNFNFTPSETKLTFLSYVSWTLTSRLQSSIDSPDYDLIISEDKCI